MSEKARANMPEAGADTAEDGNWGEGEDHAGQFKKPLDALARLEKQKENLLRTNQRLEQQICRHEEALALCYEEGSDFFFRLGKDGKFRFASPGATRTL